jgi:hypothetical protein
MSVTSRTSLVIHGHFYQPPRENPFLDEVETEASAAPYHDWNQRIERECYRAVVAARIAGADGRIARVMNTLEWISFNVGPTLLEWMEREARDTYDAMLAADRVSGQRLHGFGNAIAQPYHHTILPLASRRDKVTEVRWGIADFRRRFGREPLGMWLPETAVDDETLDVLAGEGIAFTIVAPHQVVEAPPFGRPGRYRTAAGRTIALCIYDGPLSHGIAFGGMLHDAGTWGRALLERDIELRTPPHTAAADDPVLAATPARPQAALASTEVLSTDVLVSAATDGETYGHHHRFGEMALAGVLERMAAAGWQLENFASFLHRVPAVHDVELVAATSWSCAHGVERWRADCGCRLDGTRNPSQEWRSPLRRGLDRLAAGLHVIFEREGAALFGDPWSVRDAYGAVVAAPPDELGSFARAAATGAASDAAIIRARELLEMERDALRMFTSCAWFFDDIGGIEPRQILRYAVRAIELAGASGAVLETLLLEELDRAVSNDVHVGTGRDVYLAASKPPVLAHVALAAAAAASVHAGVQATARTGSATIGITGDRVRLTMPRTGREHDLHVRVTAASAIDITTEVEDHTGIVRILHLADLPERPRHAIRSRLRRAILPRCVTAEELELLMAGDVTLAGLIRVALIRTIERLADGTPDTLELANSLVDVFNQFEAKIPFDAQTAFWRVWQQTSPTRQGELYALSRRLGFASQGLDRV